MKPNTFLTAGEAAKATGKTVPTITRAIKSGRILGGVRKGESGEYQIDPTALFSVYPMVNDPNDNTSAVNSNATPQTQGSATPLLDTAYTAAIDALRETIAAKDALIEDKEKAISEYKARLAKSENLLTDQRSEAEKARDKLAHSETLLTKQQREVEKLRAYEKQLSESEQMLEEKQQLIDQIQAELQAEKNRSPWWKVWK